MLQIAICEREDESGQGAGEAIARYLEDRGVQALPLVRIPSALEMIDRVAHPGRESLVDLLVVDCDLPGMSGLQLVRELRAAGAGVDVVLLADTMDLAYEATQQNVRACVLKPVATEQLERVLDRLVPRLVRRCEEGVELRFRESARRIPPYGVVYIETSGHDQVVHLLGGEQLSMRSSSQALFDQLPQNGTFFKNGSSYILNLAHVRQLTTKGNVVLSEGTELAVPVRVRKQLENALLGS